MLHELVRRGKAAEPTGKIRFIQAELIMLKKQRYKFAF
jgi:uncharacterized protein YcsI (UPF0317 family)